MSFLHHVSEQKHNGDDEPYGLMTPGTITVQSDSKNLVRFMF